jgi:DNA-directed RNA polymerase specialized sigma24 family protein
MTPNESVTQWIGQVKEGDHEAAQKLWESYFGRLVQLARKKLQGKPRSLGDEEDVALSAFKSFWEGAHRGKFPQLHDRTDLWSLLVAITAHKAADLADREFADKRGGGKVRGDSALTVLRTAETWEGKLAPLPGQHPEPSPAFAAQVAEECRRLLDRLHDSSLQAIAVWKMEGFRNDEIAARIGRSVPTVERRLRQIRHLWEQEMRP